MSQAKHWCEICKCWTGGHKSQIRKHMDGRWHAEKLEAYLKKSKQQEKDKKAEEKDVLKQLAEIEKAAEIAMMTGSSPQVVAPEDKIAQQRAATEAIQEQKANIQATITEAKRRRVDARWTKHVDPGSGAPYYYNGVTKESRWVKPPEFVDPEEPPASSSTAPLASQASTLAQAVDREQSNIPLLASQSSSSAQALSPDQSSIGSLASQASTPAQALSPGQSAWVVCTDPTSGHTYYFNRATLVSTWEKPPDLAVDLSKPPPPPSRKPPPPPERRVSRGGAAVSRAEASVVPRAEASVVPGAWVEVKPEDSLWATPGGGAVASTEEDSDEGPTDEISLLKLETMRRGQRMEEDVALREKEFVDKPSLSADAGANTFQGGRKRAAGMRKRPLGTD